MTLQPETSDSFIEVKGKNLEMHVTLAEQPPTIQLESLTKKYPNSMSFSFLLKVPKRTIKRAILVGAIN